MKERAYDMRLPDSCLAGHGRQQHGRVVGFPSSSDVSGKCGLEDRWTPQIVIFSSVIVCPWRAGCAHACMRAWARSWMCVGFVVFASFSV